MTAVSLRTASEKPSTTSKRLDILAGLTAAAVVVPKALAYATIAGLPVQIGLYTAAIPMVVYAFLGTSRVLSVSTTTTIAILTGAELTRVASCCCWHGHFASASSRTSFPSRS
jgi:sulfate permease, SulP family